MEEVTKETTVCKFCGRERVVVYHYNDGEDYMGHTRCAPNSFITDSGCSCSLGRIEKNKQNIKKMCLNCKHYICGECTNKKMMSRIAGIFKIPEKLEIKTPEAQCEFWELDVKIFRVLVEED